MIDGITITPLKYIHIDKGSVFHALKKSDDSFEGFGEAYFSSVLYQSIKGWKKHTDMTLNLVVPVGAIRFVIYDDRPISKTLNNFYEITLSPQNYYRLTVPPGLWLSFQGIGEGSNILLNIANIEHDPDESINIDLSSFAYPW